MDALKLRRRTSFAVFPINAMGLTVEQAAFARDRSCGQSRCRIRCAPAKLTQAGQAAWPGYACFLETSRGQPKMAEVRVGTTAGSI
jgi:hypothetical protein